MEIHRSLVPAWWRSPHCSRSAQKTSQALQLICKSWVCSRRSWLLWPWQRRGSSVSGPRCVVYAGRRIRAEFRPLVERLIPARWSLIAAGTMQKSTPEFRCCVTSSVLQRATLPVRTQSSKARSKVAVGQVAEEGLKSPRSVVLNEALPTPIRRQATGRARGGDFELTTVVS